jgi:hypothetical protein
MLLVFFVLKMLISNASRTREHTFIDIVKLHFLALCAFFKPFINFKLMNVHLNP